jgi:transposase
MANVLKVSIQEAIRSLAERGWTHRRIARELKLNRRTVARYAGPAKCTTISTPGPEPGTKGRERPRAGRPSECGPLSEVIVGKLELGLTAKRIYQDLRTEHGFAGAYQSVKRFVRRLKACQPERVWRLECLPGEEAQVDFGVGAPIVMPDGKRRKTWVLRIVLSYSRKAYSEAVLRQDTETFLRVLENAFRYFGGVPLTLLLDNLKAAVLKADWFDPELNPKLLEFSRFYGVQVLPCRPYTPEHKGKVERGVGYVQDNGLKGRTFPGIDAQNRHLLHWEETVADKRIHGTTRRQVAAAFLEEKPYLKPLPASLFPSFQEARRSVHRDGYVEVQKAYYWVPDELIGLQVWVRWDSRTVRIFNARMEQVAIHPRLEPGRFSQHLGAGGLSRPVRQACTYWVDRASLFGEHCRAWAQATVDRRGAEALRAIQGLCRQAEKHSAHALNQACAKALHHGAHRLRDVVRLLGSPAEQTRFGFAEQHPLIRDLGTYTDFINQNHHDQHHPPTSSQAAPERAA